MHCYLLPQVANPALRIVSAYCCAHEWDPGAWPIGPVPWWPTESGFRCTPLRDRSHWARKPFAHSHSQPAEIACLFDSLLGWFVCVARRSRSSGLGDKSLVRSRHFTASAKAQRSTAPECFLWPMGCRMHRWLPSALWVAPLHTVAEELNCGQLCGAAQRPYCRSNPMQRGRGLFGQRCAAQRMEYSVGSAVLCCAVAQACRSIRGEC